MSLWLLFAGTSVITLGWVWLLVSSNFEVWRDSNAPGLALQAALVLSPFVLFLGLKGSKDSFVGTTAIFAVGWAIAMTALVFFRVL